MIDRAATWLQTIDKVYSATGVILAIALWLLLGVAAFMLLRGARWIFRADDYRTRNDRVAAERILRTSPPRRETQPGTDDDLLLDAALTYYGPAGLQRLRDAITDTREGDQ